MKLFNRMRIKNDNKGLTLVEVIVSITILAVISVPLMAYFNDSLRYSAITAKQQKATALAQNITEGLKSQQVLLSPLFDTVSGNPAAVGKYNVPYLEDQNIYSIQGVSGNSYFDGKACFVEGSSNLPIGTIEYSTTMYEDGTAVSGSAVSGNGRMYDVKVTLSTISALNSGDHPIIYGMDNAVDVIAIESNQIHDAIIYFKSINSAYGDPAHRLSDDEIRSRMKRTIVADIDYITDADGNYYQVEVYYQFKCSNLRAGSSTNDEMKGSPLTYTKIKKMENLYIMYNRLHPTETDDEKIMIKLSDSVKSHGGFELPDFYLVVQNIDSSFIHTLGGVEYTLYMGINDAVGSLIDTAKIHTNLIKIDRLNNHTERTYANLKRCSTFNTDPYTDFVGVSSDFLNTQLYELTDRGPLLRSINIQTDVYEHKSDGSTGNLLASYSTSKGE